MRAPARADQRTDAVLPVSTRAAMFLRLLAVQASWNYETLLGNGIGFCVEPALRHLPGGVGGAAYRDALARQSQYFNAHPYFTAVAVGALARAELDGVAPARIERFRTALCGPLGAVGDRLVWAAFLPLCSFTALFAFAIGATPLAVVLIFLGLYNAGHLALRWWGLRIGWRDGLQVARSLGHPLFQRAPAWIARASSVVAGVALPLALQRVAGTGRISVAAVLVAMIAGGLLLARLHGRVEGWKVAVGVLAGVAAWAGLR